MPRPPQLEAESRRLRQCTAERRRLAEEVVAARDKVELLRQRLSAILAAGDAARRDHDDLVSRLQARPHSAGPTRLRPSSSSEASFSTVREPGVRLSALNVVWTLCVICRIVSAVVVIVCDVASGSFPAHWVLFLRLCVQFSGMDRPRTVPKSVASFSRWSSERDGVCEGEGAPVCTPPPHGPECVA